MLTEILELIGRAQTACKEEFKAQRKMLVGKRKWLNTLLLILFNAHDQSIKSVFVKAGNTTSTDLFSRKCDTSSNFTQGNCNSTVKRCNNSCISTVKRCNNSCNSILKECNNSFTVCNKSHIGRAKAHSFVFCDLPTAPAYRSYGMFLSVVLTVAVLGNSIVCLGILLSSRLRSQIFYYFVASLAVSDLLVAGTTLPVKIHISFHNQNFCLAKSLCSFFLFLDVFCHTSSVTNLFFISIQRFLAITRSFTCPSLTSKSKVCFVIVFCWIYAFIWSGLGMFRWDSLNESAIQLMSPKKNIKFCVNNNPRYFTCIFVVVFIIPLFIMGFLYIKIMRHIKRQGKSFIAVADNEDEGTSNRKISNVSMRNIKKRELKSTRTIAIVYGAFIICWLPLCIITISASWCQECYNKFREKFPSVHMGIYFTFVDILPPLNSAINPFIYVISCQTFRTAFMELLRGRSRRQLQQN